MKKKKNKFIEFLKKIKKEIKYQMRIEESGRIAPINAYHGKTRKKFWNEKK